MSSLKVTRYHAWKDTHDSVFGFVGVEVHTADEHGCVSRGSGDNDFLGTTLQVSRSSVKN